MKRLFWFLAAAVAVFVVAASGVRETHASRYTPQPGALPTEAQAVNCGPMDVAFVIDTTGSMGAALDSVSTAAAALVPTIVAASGGNYQLAVVTFKDNITVAEDLALSNQAAATADLVALFGTASGGGGTPEASDEALNTVINGLPVGARPQNVNFDGNFRAGALKIIILVTDAPPAGFDDTYVAAVDGIAGSAGLRANEANLFTPLPKIRISAVQVGTDPTVTPIMMNYSTVTGGVYIQTADGSGTANAIQAILDGCGGAGPVGGVSDVSINGGPGSSVADAGSGGSGPGYAMAISLATAAALSMAAGGWYTRRRWLR